MEQSIHLRFIIAKNETLLPLLLLLRVHPTVRLSFLDFCPVVSLCSLSVLVFFVFILVFLDFCFVLSLCSLDIQVNELKSTLVKVVWVLSGLRNPKCPGIHLYYTDRTAVSHLWRLGGVVQVLPHFSDAIGT